MPASNSSSFPKANELLAKKTREGLAPAALQKVQWLHGFAQPTLGAHPIAAIAAPRMLAVLRGVEEAVGKKRPSASRQPLASDFAMLSPAGERTPSRRIRSKDLDGPGLPSGRDQGSQELRRFDQRHRAYEGSPEVQAALNYRPRPYRVQASYRIRI